MRKFALLLTQLFLIKIVCLTDCKSNFHNLLSAIVTYAYTRTNSNLKSLQVDLAFE